MDTLSCTAELKPMMMRIKNNRHEITKSTAQSLLMTSTNEEDLTLGLRITKISINSLDTETKTTRQPTDRLASNEIGTEIQAQIDNIIKTDQATPGTMDQITVNTPSITSMLDQRILLPNTTKTFHRATICLHPTQSNSSMTMIQI